MLSLLRERGNSSGPWLSPGRACFRLTAQRVLRPKIRPVPTGRTPGESLGEGLITAVPFTAHPVYSDYRLGVALAVDVGADERDSPNRRRCRQSRGPAGDGRRVRGRRSIDSRQATRPRSVPLSARGTLHSSTMRSRSTGSDIVTGVVRPLDANPIKPYDNVMTSIGR